MTTGWLLGGPLEEAEAELTRLRRSCRPGP